MTPTANNDAEKPKAAEAALATPQGKPSLVEKNSLGMELVLIPAGKFMMGSPASEAERNVVDRDEDQVEVSTHEAILSGQNGSHPIPMASFDGIDAVARRRGSPRRGQLPSNSNDLQGRPGILQEAEQKGRRQSTGCPQRQSGNTRVVEG